MLVKFLGRQPHIYPYIETQQEPHLVEVGEAEATENKAAQNQYPESITTIQ